MNTIKDKFRIAVIEAIHNKPYDEAVKIESETISQKAVCGECGRLISKDMSGLYRCENITCNQLIPHITTVDVYYPLEITIGRVLKAISKRGIGIYIDTTGAIWGTPRRYQISYWQLTDQNGKECTHEDQNNETLEKILNLLT